MTSSAATDLHSHDMTELIPKLMLTHAVTVQQNRLFVPHRGEHREATTRWKRKTGM